jgi:hypothetical protein
LLVCENKNFCKGNDKIWNKREKKEINVKKKSKPLPPVEGQGFEISDDDCSFS